MMRLKRAKIFSRPLGRGLQMAQMQCGDALAALAGGFRRPRGWGRRSSPSRRRESRLQGRRRLPGGNLRGELLELCAGAWQSCHVEGRAAGGVAHFVMLEAGDDGVFAIQHPGAGRGVLGDAVERVGLVAAGTRASGPASGSTMRVLRSGSSKAWMRVASEASLRMKTGVLYLRAIRAASMAT